jgi:isopentenyl diphosphate isomerase/L-lactate dehydrogenase-like FMN-dependent dehydrogenase
MFEAGSGSNVTMRENRRAFEEVMFRPRAAVFHPERDLRTTVLGHEISMPVIVSSVASSPRSAFSRSATRTARRASPGRPATPARSSS